MIEGQTSREIAEKLLEQAIAYGDVELVGEDALGRSLYRMTPQTTTETRMYERRS